MNNVYIIAEAGVNHNGNLDIAKSMIDQAVKSGADAVKFQTFSARDLCTKSAPKAEYQKKNQQTQSQFQMLEQLALDRKAHETLIAYAAQKSIDFISSPFDLNSIDLLVCLGLEVFKIPSGEITNLPYLEKIGSLGKQIIMSTGMADMDEVVQAFNILKKAGANPGNISLLHCCSDYPAKPEDVNLRAMLALKKQFPGVKVGYSDHTMGIQIPIAAVAMGAQIIEKHFTLETAMEGPDHAASLDPEQLKGMVCAIREIEQAMGDGIKQPKPSELKNRQSVRKSIVALKNIKKGEKFSQSNITIKRPGTGISPLKWYTVMGKTAKKDFKADDLIDI